MAKYFDENEKIINILNKYPETIEFFINKGFDKLKNEKDKETLGKLSLNLILKSKGISIEGFSQMLDDFIELSRNSADITLNEKTKRTKGVKVVGLLPCPVRVPLLEQFDAFVEKHETDIQYDLKAALCIKEKASGALPQYKASQLIWQDFHVEKLQLLPYG